MIPPGHVGCERQGSKYNNAPLQSVRLDSVGDKDTGSGRFTERQKIKAVFFFLIGQGEGRPSWTRSIFFKINSSNLLSICTQLNKSVFWGVLKVIRNYPCY